MPSIETRKTHFKTLQSFKTDYSPSTFTQYESERTGMKVVVVDQKGPKVSGYFALATEIHDDSGAPHTLEHLVFMGSRNYRYKGVLDKLATRAYSNTNAWTATDHTAYTLDTAGWEGFAQILPIYLEHVLFPTLTDAGCYTEVHHVDGTGQDAGVVYSEMQGVQNNQEELMDLEARRTLYPEGVGFRYETGGMMQQLRVLTADRIREFHKEMYQPRNLCLVLVGEIDHNDMLRVLDEFEDGIADDVPNPDSPFQRPWIHSKQPPPLKESTVKEVEFPEEDESSGEIMVGFLGPDCNDVKKMAALDVLTVYLAGSSVSVLENILVEKEQLASGVAISYDARPDSVIWIVVNSVATEKLKEVNERLFEVLRETASKPLDMSYMLECIRREKRQLKFMVEDSGYFFSDAVINDFLFGKRDGSTLRDLATLSEYDELEKWSDKDWREYLSTWISEAPHVSILGVPSAKMSKKLKSDEKKRVAEQRKRLGEEGLKELEKKLEEAKAENDKPIPRELLEGFKVPGTNSIHFINTTTARSGLARKMGPLDNDIQHIIDQDSDLPLFLHFEHIPTNFVRFSLVVSAESVPVELKPLLALYTMNFFNTPIMRNGEKLDFEQVVAELEKDTVAYQVEGGSSVGNAELLQIKFQIEPEKYQTAIDWLKALIWDSVFDVERLKATITKMLADIPEEKRSGYSMMSAVDTMVHFSQASRARARNTLVKALYLKRINKLLETSPETVISKLEHVRSLLFQFSNFRVYVSADVQKLQQPVSSWTPILSKVDSSLPLSPIVSRSACLSEAGKNPGSLSYIVPMPTIDSSFGIFTGHGPSSYADPDLPKLMVAIAYLDAVEGPMWGAVRGTGLAYGTNFARDVGTGLLTFNIYRSPDAFKAYITAKGVVHSYVTKERAFEKHALEGAISSIVVSFADAQPGMASAAQVSFINQVVRGLPKEWNDVMLKRVKDVGVEDIRGVMEKLILPVFTPGKADFVVTCAPLMEESLKKGFTEVGFKPEVQPLAFFHDDYGLKPQDGEEDDEEEEEEDDEDEEGSKMDEDEDEDDDEEDDSEDDEEDE